MKKVLQIVACSIFCLLFLLPGKSQLVGIYGGKTMFPGLYAGLRYSHMTYSEINMAAGVYAEVANPNKLLYRATGLDILAEYHSGRDPLASSLAIRAGAGALVQVESEPWVYKDLSWRQRLNYGVLTEVSGIWNMTEAFALGLFCRQNFLFNKLLGSSHFVFGLNLSYRPGL